MGKYENYPTLRELLGHRVFTGSRVLGGEDALDTPVAAVNLTDTPDYCDWVSSRELLITTCYAIRNDQAAQSVFIEKLSELGLAGVCIKPSRFLGGMPACMTEVARERAFPLIELPPQVRFADITKAVSDELLRRQTAMLHDSISVNQMLLQTITAGATLHDLARSVREIAGGSVLLVDSINGRRAYSLSEADGARLAALDRDALCQALSEEGDAYEMRLDGHLFGIVCLCREAGRPPLHGDIISQLLQTIPLEISREHSVRKIESRSFTEFFQHLISDRILDDSWEQARADAFGLELSAAHALLELDLRDPGRYAGVFQRTAFFHALCQSLDHTGVDSHVMDQPQGCLILLSAREGREALERALERLPAILGPLRAAYPNLEPTGGCSRVHRGIPGLSLCRWEAQLALRAARARGGGSFFPFERLGILRLLYAGDPQRETERFIAETLGELASPQLPHARELLETLECYFRNLGNQRRMAQELYVHYNTVAYRLRSIQEITGLDLGDPTQRMQLELALYLRQVRAGGGRIPPRYGERA